MDFSKFYWLKGLKSKNKGLTNFYECCDLTKKVCLYVSTMCVSCKQAEKNINVSIELDGILCTSISGSIKK